jgi:hypothetical protein
MVSGAVFTAIQLMQWAAADSLLASAYSACPIDCDTRHAFDDVACHDPAFAKHAAFVIARNGATKRSSLLWDDELITQL